MAHPYPAYHAYPPPNHPCIPCTQPWPPHTQPQGPPPIPYAARPRYPPPDSAGTDAGRSQDVPSLWMRQNEVPTFSFNDVNTPTQQEPDAPSFAFRIDEPEDHPAPPVIAISVAPASPKASKPSYVPKLIEPQDDDPPQPEKPVVSPSTMVTTQDLANDLTCAGCRLPIGGKILSALERRWHPDCFTCANCGESLEHVEFFEWEGQPYCHFDYHEKFSLRCHHCKTPIVDETYVTLDDPILGQRYYHDLHFFCSHCGDPFIDPKSLRKVTSEVEEDEIQPLAKPFVVHDGWPYCEKCNLNLHQPKCKACSKPIVDEVLKAMDRQWHPECFVCVKCQRPFEEGYALRDGQPHCMDCYRIALRNDL